MPKLTKRTVDAHKPEDRDYFVWDTEVIGFGVRVLPSGAKTYQTQYRKGGRTRRVSIGRHGSITVDEARQIAKEIMGDVARGQDPAEDMSRHRAAPTLATLCDRFFETYVIERCKRLCCTNRVRGGIHLLNPAW
jgi:hypothetical protein